MTHTHTGYRDVANASSSGFHGHADRRGKRHALTGPDRVNDGELYKALCGEKVKAIALPGMVEEGNGYNVATVANNRIVTCKRCRRAIDRQKEG